MKKTVLKGYARLIARTGAAVQKGQPVIIVAGLEQPEFIELLAAECYRAGASEVEVDWRHQPLTRLAVRYKSAKKLGEVKAWEEEKQRWQTEALPARIVVLSEDPDGLAGIDQAKYAAGMQARYQKLRPYIDARENREQWCIAAVPGEKWAKKVFPELPKGRAVERLWEAILSCSRALEGDPLENWRLHDLDIKARAEALNAMGLTALEYRDPNGTELRVGLIPEALFLGGAERCPVNGVEYNPNIPSEELFVTPRAGDAEGVVHATRPLAVQGVLIEDFWLRFEGGRVVELHAEKNEDALRTLVGMDEGAAMLGECALVPYESPIRESGILFYNTLFDENAACHLALGRGYSSNIRDYEKYSLDELRAMGVNDSMVHEDFMIGSAELDITGLTASGERLPIFRSGGWAF
ncbi:MAG TPA: aminopeptidase [Candidatus Scatomorpha intestinigallinarum]|uniref:Aminopeptidase n=1 Tax=Candidatus Scatomorpha intestinigallinarum TaxID=2840923 RepID=A0A9D1DK05_9FIRM|nr:aminopeptidase [Candidatus Scatomorpha intestinigallinarum]